MLRDRPLWASIALAVLSGAAALYGIPFGDAEVQALVELINQGLLGISAIVAAVRALWLRRQRPIV